MLLIYVCVCGMCGGMCGGVWEGWGVGGGSIFLTNRIFSNNVCVCGRGGGV